jgi:hypothetical protein
VPWQGQTSFLTYSEAAYRRLFDKRRKLIEAWVIYCVSPGVVALKRISLA